MFKPVVNKKHPIEALIEQGEHQQQDFKFEVSDSRKIARTLSAFANTDGGRLLIGVKDNGKIAGIQGEEEFYMIEAASEMYTNPVIPFQSTYWNIGGKNVLEIYIEPGNDKPYTAPDKDNNPKAYIRVKDENILANDVLVLAWKKRKRSNGTLIKLSMPIEKLFDYLNRHTYINTNKFRTLAHINYYTAKAILSDLIAINVLNYVVVDKRIMYKANEEELKRYLSESE